MRTKFDASFDPPAPIATVIIRNQETGELSSSIRMLIDTGADVSLLPATQVGEIGSFSTAGQRAELVGIEGRKITFEIVEAQIVFAEKRFTGSYCIIDSDLGILGRDVLNQLTLVLDGPGLEWAANALQDIDTAK